MTTLCEKNRAAVSTRFMFHVCLIIQIFMGVFAWALAMGAAPKLEFSENYLAIFGTAVVGLAILAYPISYLFTWTWDSRFFGASMFPFASASFLGGYPLLCITQHGALPLLVRGAIFVIYIGLIICWCRKIAEIYKKIYSSKSLFESIYFESADVVYYLQREDIKTLKKHFKFDLNPPLSYLLVPVLVALSISPFASSASQFAGVPFVHIFLAIIGLPLNFFFLGVCTKGWLVFYHYPNKIRYNSSMLTYVDLSSTLKNYEDARH